MIFTADAAASAAIAAIALSAFAILSVPPADDSSDLLLVQKSNDITSALGSKDALSCSGMAEDELSALLPHNMDIHITVEGIRLENGSLRVYCRTENGRMPAQDSFSHRHVHVSKEGRTYLVSANAGLR